MEQLDKEVIEELSEPAKRVFRSLDYRSQRRMLKKAKEMGKQKRRKTQQKERVKKKSITKKQKKKEQAKERGSSTKRNKSRTASFVGTEIFAFWIVTVFLAVSVFDEQTATALTSGNAHTVGISNGVIRRDRYILR